MVGARDVAGAPGAGADPGRGLDHGTDHFRMLAHAEIVVGAPDHDIARPGWAVPHRMREAACDPLEIGKHAIAAFVMEAVEGGTEELAVIHRQTCSGTRPERPSLLRAFQSLMSIRCAAFGH